jgi:hypothetical protein
VDYALLNVSNPDAQKEGLPASTDRHEYWASVNEAAADVVAMMDEKESWVIENTEGFRASMDNLLKLVKDHPAITEYCLSYPREAFKLMAYLHTSTAMMLLHVSDNQRPQLIENFLHVVTDLLNSEKDGEVSVAANLALDRFLAFERSALISRIFAKDRVEGVITAIENSGAGRLMKRHSFKTSFSGE